MSNKYKYASINETPIYEDVIDGKGKKKINSILLGTYVKIVEQSGDWYKVNTAGPDGWIHKNHLSDKMGLKVFYLDVAQGDGILIEIGEYKILIDAGPNDCLYNYLTKWQYKYLLKGQKKVHIDYLIISHFDTDHFKGFIKILQDKGFEFGTICHPGILKYSSRNNNHNTGLGNTFAQSGMTYLDQIFDDLLTIDEPDNFNQNIANFLRALKKAKTDNRLGEVKRYSAGQMVIKKTIEDNDFKMEVLAPFTEKIDGKDAYIYWKDESKTINGHSLVIKVTFGFCTFLFGGDLNSDSENYLMNKYGNNNPFETDITKSCHHGSSDFTTAFMEKMKPYATIISSGDNEQYSHPRADAIGCAGKYSKGKKPLVFSTELARSVNMKNNKIIYGMINARCDGEKIYISQMKEVKKNNDIWDSYQAK